MDNYDFDDSIEEENNNGDSDDSWETCESSDEDDENEYALMGAFIRHMRGWLGLEDFEETEYESESSCWSDDNSDASDWVWQTTDGRDSPVNEEHLSFGVSINIVDLLNAKETGIKSKQSKARRKSSFLAFFFSHWSSVSQKDMLENAVLLLGRSIYQWEGCVLKFLNTQRCQRLAKEETMSDPLMHTLLRDWFTPITFTDIISALVKSGDNLLATDESGKDLLIELVDRRRIHEDCADFIELLIKRGLDIQWSGEVALQMLCSSIGFSFISNAKLQIIKLIFDAGLTLSETAKRDLMKDFSQNILVLANESVVEILKLLLSKGCQASEALSAIKSQGHISHLLTKENLQFILEIVLILLENGAPVNSAKDTSEPNFVFKILEMAAHQPNHPSMLPFIEKCIQRGLDLTVTRKNLENFLMGFCEKYKHQDLPRIIHLLCSSGIDVNQVDQDGKNALFYLSLNRPVYRKSICDAVRALLELNIDAKRVNSVGLNALLSFLVSEHITYCCTYKTLKLFNESNFWETLNLLLDTGIDVNQTDLSKRGSLISFLKHWSVSSFYIHGICEDCLNNDFPLMFEKEALESLGVDPFKPVVRFVERLLEAGADTRNYIPCGFESILHYVCSCFEGELLIALVNLFCKAGVHVQRMKISDVIELLKLVNPTQVQLISRLIDVMMRYGFNVKG